MELNEIEVIDNCFYGPLTFKDTVRAFQERFPTWNVATKAYQLKGNTDYLDSEWPKDRFKNPQIPIALYASIQDAEMFGFLESKIHYRDYAILRQLVTFDTVRESAIRSQVVRKLTQRWVQDCREMGMAMVVIPRATKPHNNIGAKYNLMNVTSAASWEIHWGELCRYISVEFPYMSFETPFSSYFIYVRPGQEPLVANWVHYCLLPTRNSRKARLDFCKMHHYSLWRTQDPEEHGNRTVPLQPHEVDILIQWQKKDIVHQALRIDADSKCPSFVFGKRLVQVPEHTHRLQVTAYRHIQRVPYHISRTETTDWVDFVSGQPIRYLEDDLDLAGAKLTNQQAQDTALRIVKQAQEKAIRAAKEARAAAAIAAKPVLFATTRAAEAPIVPKKPSQKKSRKKKLSKKKPSKTNPKKKSTSAKKSKRKPAPKPASPFVRPQNQSPIRISPVHIDETDEEDDFEIDRFSDLIQDELQSEDSDTEIDIMTYVPKPKPKSKTKTKRAKPPPKPVAPKQKLRTKVLSLEEMAKQLQKDREQKSQQK